MNLLVRWTIGDVSKEGINCLKFSVRSFLKIYGKDFKYYICYNKIKSDNLSWAKDFGVELIDQSNHISSLDAPPISNHPCWKLYPPRINLDYHELFLDNDVVIYKKIDLDFVKFNFFISQARRRNYGKFDNIVPSNFPNLNTGFFSIPPKFDFAKEINELIKKFNSNWKDHFDEQGLLATIFSSKNFKLIELEDLYVCSEEYKLGRLGTHFGGLNRGENLNWKRYLCKFL